MARPEGAFGSALDGLIKWEPVLVLAALPLFVLYQPYSWAGILVALVPWAARLLRGRPAGRSTPLDWPLVVFLLGALVGLWAAYDLATALARLYGILGAVILYYLIINNSTSLIWQRLFVAMLVMSAAAFSLYFVTQNDFSAGDKFPYVTQLGEWITARFPQLPWHRPHPNMVASYLVSVLPLAVAATWASRAGPRWRRLEPAAWAAAILVILLALVFTESRSAWFALVGTTALWLISRLPLGRWIGCAAVLAGAAVFAVAIVARAQGAVAFGWLTGVLGSIPAGTRVVDRVDLYADILGLVRDYVFTGLGLGGMPFVYTAYDLMLGPQEMLSHAHNLFLEIWLEQGTIGIAAFVWMSVSLLAARAQVGGRSGGTEGSKWQSAIGRGAAWGFAALLLQGIWDSGIYSSRALPVFLVLPGLAIAGLSASAVVARASTSATGWQRAWVGIGKRPRLGAAILGLGLIMMAWWQWHLLAAQWQADFGAVAQDRGDLVPELAPPLQVAYEQEAERLYRAALSSDPANTTALRRLGGMLLNRGDYLAAAESLERARTSEPADAATAYLLATTYIGLGETEGAIRLWRGIPNAARMLEIEAWRFETQRHDAEAASATKRLAARLAAEGPAK
jgi:O-antigen ligase